MTDKLSPIHPGEVLLEEFIKPMNLSQNRLAIDIGVDARSINEIVLGKRSVIADNALRLSRFFGNSPNSGWDCKPSTILILPRTVSANGWTVKCVHWQWLDRNKNSETFVSEFCFDTQITALIAGEGPASGWGY